MDKTQTRIEFVLHLDAQNERVEKLEVVLLCAQKGPKNQSIHPKRAFSSAEHIAIVSTYTFSRRGEVDRFQVPRAAVRLLK